MADLSGSTQICSIKTTLPSGLMGGVYFETTGATPALLNDFTNTTLTVPFSGVWASSQNISFTAEKLGHKVTLTLQGFNLAASMTGIISTAAGALPSAFCPGTNTVYGTAIVVDNSADTVGMMSVSTVGVISISILGANFAATELAGWQKMPFSYSTLAL